VIDEQYFDSLITSATGQLTGDEVLLSSLHTEATDFARFNDAKVRQAGSVDQTTIEIDLVEGQRHTAASLQLSGELDVDTGRVGNVLQRLREQRAVVPADPHLIVNTEPTSTHHVGDDQLPDRDQALAAITDGAGDRDLVGIYPDSSGTTRSLTASSPMHRRSSKHWLGSRSI